MAAISKLQQSGVLGGRPVSYTREPLRALPVYRSSQGEYSPVTSDNTQDILKQIDDEYKARLEEQEADFKSQLGQFDIMESELDAMVPDGVPDEAKRALMGGDSGSVVDPSMDYGGEVGTTGPGNAVDSEDVADNPGGYATLGQLGNVGMNVAQGLATGGVVGGLVGLGKSLPQFAIPPNQFMEPTLFNLAKETFKAIVNNVPNVATQVQNTITEEQINQNLAQQAMDGVAGGSVSGSGDAGTPGAMDSNTGAVNAGEDDSGFGGATGGVGESDDGSGVGAGSGDVGGDDGMGGGDGAGGGDGTCIIVTACTNRYSYEVNITREFRDTCLDEITLRGYYRLAKYIVPQIKQSQEKLKDCKENLVDKLIDYAEWFLGKKDRLKYNNSESVADRFLKACYLIGGRNG